MNPQINPNTMNYKRLHEHILQEHDLWLFDELEEIVLIVLEITDNKIDIIDDYPLFEHMDKYYGVTLLESQMREIIDIVLEMHNEKPEKCTMDTNCKVEVGMLYGQKVCVCRDQSKNHQITIK